MAASFAKLEQHKLTNVKFTDHELGHGSCATVFEVKYNGIKCAAKKIHDVLTKEGSNTYTLCHFEEECHLMSQIHHPNIVKFLGVYFPKHAEVPILIMEFLPINLTYCIEKEGSLPQEMKYSILNDVAQGFYYLHSQVPPIVHRDLTSNNVLLTTNMRAKISDLGVARILDTTHLQISHMTQVPGTPAYMPPEVVVEKPKYDTSIDTFSYGVLMIHVFCGKWPIPQVAQIRIEGKDLIPVSEAERREVFLKAIGDNHPLMALILRCIDNNPQARPPTKEISEELAEIVQQHPLNVQAVLKPILPVANKRKKEKAKCITDYDCVEIKVVTKETTQKVVVKPAEVKQEESISWARKQIKRTKAFFMQKYQPKQAPKEVVITGRLQENGQDVEKVTMDNISDDAYYGTYPVYVAKCDFESQGDDVLSFKKGDEFRVISTDPGTKWLAYSQNIGEKGYIPSDCVTEATYPIHAALYDYESRSEEELGFEKGDLLCIINANDNGWWFARSKKTEKEGYIPSNYVTSSVVDINNTLYVHKWFFGNISRSNAEKMLLSSFNQRGSFIIRNSETCAGNNYAVSIRCRDEKIRHYRLKQIDGTFAVSNGITFESIPDLVAHYQWQAGGLHTQLVHPCVYSEKSTTAGLSRHTNSEWEIDRVQIKLVEKIGTRQFGEIWKGLWNNTPIAVKTLKPGAMAHSEFLQEAAIMKKLRHENILQLYGVSTKEKPIYIISEFMTHGSLLEYLRSKGLLCKHFELMKIVKQIIAGMSYLEENNYVHRNLAARNILVGDNLVCKVADFGLARLIEAGVYEQDKAKVAVRWTAPEVALYNRFSNKSDVWSFGIVLYEIITYGRTPYPSMTNMEVLQKVEQGYRMPQPKNCTYQFHNLMLKCWRAEPEHRLTFKGLQLEIQEML